MSSVYVVGCVGSLHVRREPPLRWEGRDSGGRPWVRYGWPLTSTQHVAARGALWEGKSFDGRRIFARAIPEDAVERVDSLEAEIAEAEAKLLGLRRDLQALLEASAMRGRRVSLDEAIDASRGIASAGGTP